MAQGPDGAKNKPNLPEEKIFDRVIKVTPKTKLKGLRKAVLEELGMQDMCAASLFAI